MEKVQELALLDQPTENLFDLYFLVYEPLREFPHVAHNKLHISVEETPISDGPVTVLHDRSTQLHIRLWNIVFHLDNQTIELEYEVE